MKNFRNYLIATLATIISIFTVGTVPCFASNNTDFEYKATMELQPGETIDIDDVISTLSTSSGVDQTFNIGSYHRGGDRSYSTSHLRFKVTITDTNGNATSDNVTITLKDYNMNTQSWTIAANGTTSIRNGISIVAGRLYYFTYTNSGSKTLKVHMVITPY